MDTITSVNQVAPAAQTTEAGLVELPCSDFSIISAWVQLVYDELVVSFSERSYNTMRRRLERGLLLAQGPNVVSTEDPAVFYVVGNQKPLYTVDLVARTCDCPDCSMIPANYCKHRVAAYLYSEAVQRAQAVINIPTEPEEMPEPELDLSEPEVIDVTNVSYITIKLHKNRIKLELVETSDGQVSARALLPDAAPLWINSGDRKIIAETLETYV